MSTKSNKIEDKQKRSNSINRRFKDSNDKVNDNRFELSFKNQNKDKNVLRESKSFDQINNNDDKNSIEGKTLLQHIQDLPPLDKKSSKNNTSKNNNKDIFKNLDNIDVIRDTLNSRESKDTFAMRKDSSNGEFPKVKGKRPKSGSNMRRSMSKFMNNSNSSLHNKTNDKEDIDIIEDKENINVNKQNTPNNHELE